MALTQIVYVSRREPSCSPAVLQDIVRASSEANAKRGITGVLLCLGEHVLQLLEGELPAITALYEHISRDPRHGDVQMLLSKTIAKRLFPEWGMALADFDCTTALNRPRLLSLINDIRATCNTSNYSVEARVLLTDFKQQLLEAA